MNFLETLSAKLPFKKKEETAEYYLALIIGLSEVTAAVWVIFESEVDLLGKKSLPYKGNDDLLDKAYQALDQAVEGLEVEPKKILFGVPDAWSIDDNLKEPYLKLLQKLLKEADLEPVAYVTVPNALSFFLERQEGTPLTAILLGLGNFAEATLVRGGKIAGTRMTERGEHLFDDLAKILNEFTEVEVLPSKILLYQTQKDLDLEKVKDELMSYPWMSKLSFLHFPKIEILGEAVTVQAVVVAGASEMYPAVDLKHSFLQKEAREEKISHAQTFPQEEGFVKGDIREQSQKLEVESQNKEKEENVESREPVLEEDQEEEIVPRPVPEETLEEDNLLPQKPLSLLLTLKQRFISLSSRFVRVIPARVGFNRRLIIAPLFFLALVLGYLFLVKATVTVFVEPKTLEKVTEVVADPKATAFSEEKKIIPGKLVEITVSGSSKDQATGTKKIGDPAKGQVVVYNLTSNKVSFSQGSNLTSSEGLKFTLDSSVQIASQSSSVGADFTTVITPGKSDPVRVTAAFIGPEGNLPAGVEFSVAGYSKSQVVAKVTEALSGGTSKEVTVVTSDDQKRLKAKVLVDLRQKAEGELQGKIAEGQRIVSDALVAADGQYNFSKQVGDQAKEFSLSANVHFKGTSYAQADLQTMVSRLVTIEVPEGYEMSLQNAETQADVVGVDKEGKVTFKARFLAKLLPKWKTDDLKKQIRGKSVEEAAATLRGLENVIGSEIRLSPSLPAKISRLPILPQNITLKISPK